MGRLAVMNAALLLTGNKPIQNENENSPEYLISDAHYRNIIEAELERHHYHFAETTAKLESRINGDFGFSAGFQLPADAVMVRSVYNLTCHCGRTKPCPVLNWEQKADRLYLNPRGDWGGCSCDCGATALTVLYTSRCPEEERWGPNFRRGVEYRLAAIFARGINEESGEAAQLDAEADRYFTIARVRSSRADNSVHVAPRRSRLHRAHYGWGGN